MQNAGRHASAIDVVDFCLHGQETATLLVDFQQHIDNSKPWRGKSSTPEAAEAREQLEQQQQRAAVTTYLSRRHRWHNLPHQSTTCP